MSDVRIADSKTRLSERLRSVRNGGTVTVLDRDTPVARIIPVAAPSSKFARQSVGSVTEAATQAVGRTDSPAFWLRTVAAGDRVSRYVGARAHRSA